MYYLFQKLLPQRLFINMEEIL